jgi:hypothetical protein
MKMALYGRHLILKNKIHYTIVHLAELFHASFVNYIEQADERLTTYIPKTLFLMYVLFWPLLLA